MLPVGQKLAVNTGFDHITPILEGVDGGVLNQVRLDLENLHKYADLFSRDEFDLDCTSIVTHQLNTRNH